MSNNFNYDDVQVVLLDQNLSMRRLIRGALQTIGLSNITECRSIEDVKARVLKEQVDLVILDLDTDTERVCAAIQDIRNDRIGTNPFMVIMALTGAPDRKIIGQTLHAGTDDLVAKPISPKLLMERIENLVRNRKKFRVTADYIGPERSKKAEPGAKDSPTLTVPNTLRYKAAGDDSAADGDAIKRTSEEAKLRRAQMLAAEVAAQAQELEKSAAHNQSMPVSKQNIRELKEQVLKAHYVIARLDNDHLTRISTSMAAVVEAIIRAPFPNVRQIQVLRLHAQAIMAAIQDAERAPELVAAALSKAAAIVGPAPAAPMAEAAPGGRSAR